MESPLLGELIQSRYQIKEFLGEKGTTQMFSAVNVQNQQRYVIEFFGYSFPIPEPKTDTLMNSLQVLAALDHPNLVKVIDVGVHKQMAYVVREPVVGRPLQEFIDESFTRPMTKERGTNIVYQVGQGLAYGEKFSLSHGFLHPHNIIIEKAGRAVLLNFGVRPIVDRVKGEQTHYINRDIRALGNIFDKLMLLTDLNQDVEQIIFKLLGVSGHVYPSYNALLVDLEYLRSNVKTTILTAEKKLELFGERDPSTILKKKPPTEELEEEKPVLFLYFPDIGHVHTLEHAGEFTIGRRFKGQALIPDVDLTDFDAYQWGISKIHASVTVAEQGDILLTDMGSSNGTFINGTRLELNQSIRIEDRAIVMMGRLRMQFVYPEENQNENPD